MKSLAQFKISSSSLVIVLAVLCLASRAQAVSPTPDGCYPNFTTAEGCDALNFLTTGAGNTGLGWRSLFFNTDASFNTGVGGGALALNNADSNTAVGAAAMLLNTTGTLNTAVGTDALVFNDSGSLNTAVGSFTLFSNTTGGGNTAVGSEALSNNTSGQFDTATGLGALQNNTSGNNNTACGSDALFFNTMGGDNTATGLSALFANTEGDGNTAVGRSALNDNTTGNNNTAMGGLALLLNTTGNNNTALGAGAGTGVTTADNVICIGSNVGGQNVSNTTWIGNVFGTTTISGMTAPVIVSNTGQLGTISSSRRFKREIKPMDKGSEAILAFKPVTFHYKSDASGTPQFGLIAEEVAEVNPDLVMRDKNGKIYSVRYDAVNAMLLNEFLKAHRRIEEQKATIARLEKQVEALAAGLQKVSAQIELSKPAPETVVNNQ